MIFLKKDERQALRTRKHYMQIFLERFYWYFNEISMLENYVGISHHLNPLLKPLVNSLLQRAS